MKPRKGESQDDFMARCMHETFGPSAPADRTQEQAVAICFGYWRDEHGGEPPKAVEVQRIIARGQAIAKGSGFSIDDTPDPDEDENQDEFLDRCIDEIAGEDASEDEQSEAEEVCSAKWDEYSRSKLKPGVTIFRTHSEPIAEGTTNFVLSDETVDRMGEIINSTGWQLDDFKKNPIALFNHRSDFPIGRWRDLAVDDGKLKGHLELAPAGTSERIDEIRRLVKAGILQAVSVGFRSLKKEPVDEKSDNFWGPFRYLKQELVECSLVSVPANPNALAVAKSLKISPETIDAVFAGSGKRERISRRGFTGGSARTNGRRGAMTLAQRITDVQSQIIVKQEALKTHLEGSDDSNVSDADIELRRTLNAEIAQLTKTRDSLVESEKNLAATMGGNGSGKTHLPAIVTNGGGNGSAIATGGSGPLVSTIGKKDLTLLDYLVRGGTVAYVSKMWGEDPRAVSDKIYGDDVATRGAVELVIRTASAPAMTTVTGWAAELVQQIWTAIMPTLMPNAVLTRLAAKGLALSFGRAGKINIPTRSRTPSVAGSFVGEGQAIPVRQGAFTTQALVPKKLAVITTWTREMDEHSIPAIEGVLREAIQVDSSVAADTVLLDANPATLIRPAGLLNGVAALTATAGGGLTALTGDLKLLIGGLAAGTYGNIRVPAWIMNPVNVLNAGLTAAPNTGIFPFKDEVARGMLGGIPIIDSTTVTLNTMILVDAADFVVADGGAPRFEISDQATLHMEDTNPTDLVAGSPGVVASPQRSLFQTDSLALKMVLPINWLQRRAGTIVWTQNITW
jgi:HK97 family phage prohead protease/HK97 family phage major capsid protein